MPFRCSSSRFLSCHVQSCLFDRGEYRLRESSAWWLQALVAPILCHMHTYGQSQIDLVEHTTYLCQAWLVHFIFPKARDLRGPVTSRARVHVGAETAAKSEFQVRMQQEKPGLEAWRGCCHVLATRESKVLMLHLHCDSCDRIQSSV